MRLKDALNGRSSFTHKTLRKRSSSNMRPMEIRKLSTNLLTSTASAHGSKNRWKIPRSENKTGPAKEKMRAVPASTLMKTWKRTMASMLISSSLSRYRRQQHRRHQQPHIFQKQTSTIQNWLEINVELFCEIISSKAKKCFKKELRSFCGYGEKRQSVAPEWSVPWRPVDPWLLQSRRCRDPWR